MKNFEVRIYSPDSTEERWYVYIYNTETRKIIKKLYKGINSKSDLKVRMMYCEMYKDTLEKEIKAGWTPGKAAVTQKTENLKICDALDFALDKKKADLSKDSHGNYNCAVNFFKEAVVHLKFSNVNISDVERFHVKSVMDHIQQKRNWTGKEYNKNMGYIKSLFSELVEWEYIKFNIIRDIRPKKEEKTEGYILATDKQHKKISKHLHNIDYNYYVFYSIEYYLGIRPKEILLLKCGDINIEHKIIRIASEDSKDNSYRYVPIFEPVLSMLKKMDLSNKEYYLIGRPKPYGCRFFKHEYFCPNPYSIKRDTATRKWKEYVIDGLGINVKCYSFKHKGANDKLKAGMDLKTISEIFGHSDEKMTELYANHINSIRFEEASKIVLDEY